MYHITYANMYNYVTKSESSQMKIVIDRIIDGNDVIQMLNDSRHE